MKALLVYDSVFGNTAQIAQAIGKSLAVQEEVEVLQVREVKPEKLGGLHLLVVGSPTRGFRPTPAITNLLEQIPTKGLQGIQVAAFDTRISVREIKSAILSFFVKLSGPGAYAAKHIADKLTQSGGKLIAPPEGFFVQGTEGPLKEGELERAKDWVRQIVRQSSEVEGYKPVLQH